MIIVTGGAGFIGSNIVTALNKQGITDIIVVDDLTDGKKFDNLVDCDITDYLDKDDFIHKITKHENNFPTIKAILHQGACSKTTEWDGRYMMQNNYEYSKKLLHFCLKQQIPLIYASSAAVYGNNKIFQEEPACEKPLNVYGYSKLQFDRYVRRLSPQAKSQIVGLRYFNVYGPNEHHKGPMASVAFHFNEQLKQYGTVKLFVGCDDYADGEQLRDFIYVADVVAINLWFLNRPQHSGIFNVGTGRTQTFNAVAKAVTNWHGKGKIEYIPFPEHLKGCYQSFTQANITKLRKLGCDLQFRSIEQGVKDYLLAIKEVK